MATSLALRLEVGQWEMVRAGLLDLNVGYSVVIAKDPTDPDSIGSMIQENLDIIWAIEDMLGWDRSVADW